jgi:hypothetical protein
LLFFTSSNSCAISEKHFNNELQPQGQSDLLAHTAQPLPFVIELTDAYQE